MTCRFGSAHDVAGGGSAGDHNDHNDAKDE
jgi:hypothetical protein